MIDNKMINQNLNSQPEDNQPEINKYEKDLRHKINHLVGFLEANTDYAKIQIKEINALLSDHTVTLTPKNQKKTMENNTMENNMDNKPNCPCNCSTNLNETNCCKKPIIIDTTTEDNKSVFPSIQEVWNVVAISSLFFIIALITLMIFRFM